MPSYMGWHDATKNKPLTQKIHDAVARYTVRHGSAPDAALVSSTATLDSAEVAGVAVTLHAAVPAGVVYVGRGVWS